MSSVIVNHRNPFSLDPRQTYEKFRKNYTDDKHMPASVRLDRIAEIAWLRKQEELKNKARELAYDEKERKRIEQLRLDNEERKRIAERKRIEQEERDRKEAEYWARLSSIPPKDSRPEVLEVPKVPNLLALYHNPPKGGRRSKTKTKSKTKVKTKNNKYKNRRTNKVRKNRSRSRRPKSSRRYRKNRK